MESKDVIGIVWHGGDKRLVLCDLTGASMDVRLDLYLNRGSEVSAFVYETLHKDRMGKDSWQESEITKGMWYTLLASVLESDYNLIYKEGEDA